MTVGGRPSPLAVIVAGGGIAGLEAVLALRALAGRRVGITLVTEAGQTIERPMTVAEPFDRATARTFDIRAFADEQEVDLHFDRLTAVHGDDRTVELASGQRLRYDALVVATGAGTRPVLPGAVGFRGEADVAGVRDVLGRLRDGSAGAVAFALPDRTTWPLPLYELALMTGAELRAAGRRAELTIVTPEAAPLAVFGPAAADAAEPLLRQRGVTVRAGCRPTSFADGWLDVDGGRRVRADAVIATVAAHARVPLGLPRDRAGFVPVDAHARVAGMRGVFAAGDLTDGALKQGGLAAQQADAAAEAIAAQLGLVEEPAPVRPVLRGRLLVGGEPLFLRAELDGLHEPIAVSRSEASARPLWSPPAKVAARYLAPYFATARRGGHATLVDLPGPAAAG